ncbi:AbiH family protein [Empedobacter brevis]|uniref:AbiH family protein n=1 Tax=Empedobacter brevis TaxID=247 RepID=UPI0028969FB1|nr:AbiH family protein [Empedobacter brevis]
MSKILITGNGFDLNLNLPTSYSDFIRILRNLKNLDEYNFDSVYNVSSSYESIKNNFDNNIEFKKNEIEELKDLLNKNLWFNFFTSEYNIETWIDFETKIEYVLINIFKALSTLEKYFFSDGSRPHTSRAILFKNFYKNIEYYTIFENFKLFEIEGSHIIFNQFLFNKKHEHNINFNYEEISEYLQKDLMQFKKVFNLYFEIFVLPLYDKLKVNNKLNLKTIDHHFTFNYTPTFEKVYGRNIRTDFLHGKIDSKSNFIVLGINEVPDNINENHVKYFIPFTKYYQKLNNNTDYYFLNDLSGKNTFENYIFYFIGHSLDKSDEDYINEIFNFINDLKTKGNQIVISYHSKNSKSKMLINLIEIRGKDDIVNLMRNKVLVFEKLNSKEFEEALNLKLVKKTKGVKSYKI